MPDRNRPPLTRAVVLRGAGFVIAIALGAVAVWLVVTSDDQQNLRIGMLVGLWGLLLGAYSMFGARRGMGVEVGDDPGHAIALREARTVERRHDADERRDWEARLERLIAREVGNAVGRETATLRTEIAHLRQELLEKVGGQLRLERIETTRVIGSDLEALQHEVRQLKDANGNPAVADLIADSRFSVRPIVEAARVRPVTRPTAEIESDVRPAVSGDDARPAATGPRVEPAPPGAAPPTVAPPAPVTPAVQPAAETAPLSGWRPFDRPEQRPEQRPEPRIAAQRPSEPIRRLPEQRPPARPEPRIAAQWPGAQPGPAVPTPEQRPAAPSSGAPIQPPAPVPAMSTPVTSTAQRDTESAEDPAARVHRPPTERPEPAKQEPPQQPTRPAFDEDPFASLPRLSRFTDIQPDPVENTNGHSAYAGHRRARDEQHEQQPEANPDGQPRYSGRRRRSDEDEGLGRHSSVGDEPHEDAEPVGRRHRSDDDGGGDLLARLLARESSEH